MSDLVVGCADAPDRAAFPRGLTVCRGSMTGGSSVASFSLLAEQSERATNRVVLTDDQSNKLVLTHQLVCAICFP